MKAIEGIKKPDMEVIAACQRECEIQVKTLNSIASFYGIASKNKRTMQGLERMNVMDDSTAIDLGLADPEVDKVKCPYHGDLITRAECLDYSGAHIDDCSGCEIGKATKEKLLPLSR
jgi:hypothetical protein